MFVTPPKRMRSSSIDVANIPQSSKHARTINETKKKELKILFLDEEYEQECVEKSMLEVLNLKLSCTTYCSTTIENQLYFPAQQEVILSKGVMMYFAPISQIDFVWRSIACSHAQQARFGPVVQIRACEPPNNKTKKKQQQEKYDNEEWEERVCFYSGNPLATCCTIVPVDAADLAQVLFRGAAIINALNLSESEPVYVRNDLPFTTTWEQCVEGNAQETCKLKSTLKVQRINGVISLFQLEGIYWKQHIM